jgi:hypothetical protein
MSLSIGIDPITKVQDIDRAEELLRRLDVPEEDAAWDNLRSYRAAGEGRREARCRLRLMVAPSRHA